MAVPRINEDYDPVQSVRSEGGGASPFEVRYTPQDFGAGVSQAVEQGADKAFDQAQHFQKMATEANVNNTIANQFAPAAAKLKADFYSKQGIDAVHAQPQYLASLDALRQNTLKNQSPYAQELLSQYMSRHVAQENDGAAMHADQQLTKYEDESHTAYVNTLGSNAISGYNNADTLKTNQDMMFGAIQKFGMDRGQPQTYIEEQKRNSWGTAINGAVGRAVAGGDVATANRIYEDNKDFIPGHQRLEIDKMLHSENMRQTGHNNAQAIIQGNQLPTTAAGGVSAYQARIATVTAAQDSGVDPNHALTVLRIESSDGQNLGKRGDIGQTGKGGDLPTQAHNMVAELAKSKTVADNALGRTSEPWEQYVCYQQGAGGGPALLKAAQDNPNARAVDVLSPLYKTPAQALSAIVNNGGNATMTSGQFLDFIKNNYAQQAQRAACAMPGKQAQTEAQINPEGGATVTQEAQPANLAQALQEPHQNNGVATQPGATPVQTLLNFDKNYPDMLNRANSIPNLDEREATIRALEQQHSIYQAAAGAWKTQFQNKAQMLATDPNFTDIAQIPADMKAALADSPQTMTYLETRANYNLEHKSGTTNKDMREYGNGFYDLFKGIHSSADAPGHISDITQLQSHIGKDGDLTIAGYDRLLKEMSGKNTPDGEAESAMKKQFLANAKAQISGADEGLHLKDPKGDQLYLKFLANFFPAYEKARGEGKTAAQLFNPESSDYLGKSIAGFKRPMSQWVSDMMQDGGEQHANRSLQDIIRDVQSGKLTSDAGKKEAMGLGLIREEQAQVPRPE